MIIELTLLGSGAMVYWAKRQRDERQQQPFSLAADEQAMILEKPVESTAAAYRT